MSTQHSDLQQCNKPGCGRFWKKEVFTKDKRTMVICPKCRKDRNIQATFWTPTSQGSPSDSSYNWPSMEPNLQALPPAPALRSLSLPALVPPQLPPIAGPSQRVSYPTSGSEGFASALQSSQGPGLQSSGTLPSATPAYLHGRFAPPPFGGPHQGHFGGQQAAFGSYQPLSIGQQPSFGGYRGPTSGPSGHSPQMPSGVQHPPGGQQTQQSQFGQSSTGSQYYTPGHHPQYTPIRPSQSAPSLPMPPMHPPGPEEGMPRPLSTIAEVDTPRSHHPIGQSPTPSRPLGSGAGSSAPLGDVPDDDSPSKRASDRAHLRPTTAAGDANVGVVLPRPYLPDSESDTGSVSGSEFSSLSRVPPRDFLWVQQELQRRREEERARTSGPQFATRPFPGLQQTSERRREEGRAPTSVAPSLPTSPGSLPRAVDTSGSPNPQKITTPMLDPPETGLDQRRGSRSSLESASAAPLPSPTPSESEALAPRPASSDELYRLTPGLPLPPPIPPLQRRGSFGLQASQPSPSPVLGRPARSRLAALGSSPEKVPDPSTPRHGNPSSSSATGYYTAPEPETPTPALGQQYVPPAHSFQPLSSAHGRQLFPPPQAVPYLSIGRGTLAQGQHTPQPAPGHSNVPPVSNQGLALALSAAGDTTINQASGSRFYTAAQVPQFPNLMYPTNVLARRGSPGLYGPSGLQRSHSPKRTSSPDSSETQRARRSSIQTGNTATCRICRNHRPVHIVNAGNVCVYCDSGVAEHEVRYCASCRVMRDGNDFLADGPDCICTFCLNPPSLTSEDWSERLASSRRRSRSSSASSTSSFASTTLRRTSNLKDPNERDPVFSTDAQQLSNADFERAETFRNAMNRLSRETCGTCNRSWFDSNIVNSSCLACRGKDVKSAIPFYSGANYLSVGTTPGLPKLSILEEMSIARVSAMLEVWSVQEGSAGRVTSYLREEARVYSVLPIPIQEVGIVVVAPSNGTNINRQFLDHTLYRRDSVRIWLEFLVQNHPGYRGVTINHHALDQLMPQIHGLNKLPTETKQETINVSLPITPPIRTAKPTLLSLHTFAPIDPTQTQTYETVPIADMNTKRPCLSWMFPTLYPTGQAEFCRPRPRTIPFAEYLSHLIRQEDARFVQHPQWLYASFNLLLSQQIQGRTRYLASKLPKALNLLDIKQAIAEGDQSSILKYLVSDMRVLRGTRPYWQMRIRELKAQAAALGDPNLFLTLSADNGGWESLRRLLPGLSASPSYVAIREAIVANPHIVLHHFMRRQQTFMETVFRPKFDVTDWWTRFEYQANGAVHLHAFSWNNGTPPFVPMTQIDNDVQAHLNRNQPLAAFWDPHITALNPQHVIPQSDLSLMIGRFQTHRHSVKCAPQDGSCRIGFPRPLTAQAEIGLSHSNRVVFIPRRDDPMLNQYNRVVSFAWSANTDIQPMIDGERALEYATKDAVVASDHSGHELSTVANITSPQIRLAASVARHVADQKEYHGQEICHQLLGHGLTESSRGTVIVDCRKIEDQPEVAGKSLMRRYIERRAEFNHLTLLDFATKYDFAKDVAPITRQRVPVFIPKFDSKNESEDYARAKLMLRHTFSRSVDELLMIGPPELQPFPTFAAAWQHCRTSHVHLGIFDTLDARSATQTHDQDVAVDQDWSLLLDRLEQESFEIHLGKRDMDTAHVWPVNTYQVDTNFWSKIIQRPLLPANLVAPDAVNLLNEEQLNVHRKVMSHFQTAFNSDTAVEPFRVQVDGPAGSGKTFLINTISFHLESLANHMEKRNPVLRVSPTAAAAFGISGNTIHSALEIRVGRQFAPLDDATCKRLRDDYASVNLIVIDEKSMIDLRLLYQIDQRCQQIWNNKRPFGDMCVLLTGDFAQLPPVMGKPLYACHELTEDETRFQRVYRSFDKTVRLTRIVRQSGDMRLQTILNELRDNAVSDRSCDLLASRCMSLLSTREIHDFDEAVRIYNTNAQVDQFNISRLRTAGVPVLRIDAIGRGQDWNRASDDAAGSLKKALYLSIGTRVMLTTNLSTSTGAKNGATGIVRHIVFAADKTPRVDMPSAVLVELEKYTGPTMDIGGRHVVPIFPVTREYVYNGHKCYRTQFPLAVAYAMTVHASQGATIAGKAVYDISRRDWVHGLTYTALSRVTTLDSMMLELPFGRELFATTVAEKKESSYIRQRKLDELRRANQPW